MKILVAGSTGYLGSYIVRELLNRQMDFQAIARKPKKLEALGLAPTQIITAQATNPQSLQGCCHGVEVVISSLGITRQKDGLTYEEVDYGANKNLLDEAVRSGVKKFIYVSVLRGEDLTNLQICAAKERFVQELESSGLDYCIIRPSGFFSDIKEFFDMAKAGRVYLLGDGQTRVNPIHGADLAELCVAAIYRSDQVIEVGGPEVLTHQQIANLAFKVLDKKSKISYLPDGLRRLGLWLSARLLSKPRFGPVEFFLHVMAMDMVAPQYGKHQLRSFFETLK